MTMLKELGKQPRVFYMYNHGTLVSPVVCNLPGPLCGNKTS